MDVGVQPAAAARYSKVAAWLHLLIAVAVIVTISIALRSEDLPREVRKEWMGVHMTLGILILLLTVVRILWRLTHRPPAQPSSLPAWQAKLGGIVHVIFYVMLLGLPLAGWIWMSARTEPVVIDMFGLFNWPVLPIGDNKALRDMLHEGHEIGGLAMLGLVILHILGALKHQFTDTRGYLGRMNPFG